MKTDAKDAVHLARLLRLDEITPVSVPTADQEAARDLVRTREDCRGDLMRASIEKEGFLPITTERRPCVASPFRCGASRRSVANGR